MVSSSRQTVKEGVKNLTLVDLDKVSLGDRIASIGSSVKPETIHFVLSRISDFENPGDSFLHVFYTILSDANVRLNRLVLAVNHG